MSWEGSEALVWDAVRLRIAADAAGIGLWPWDVHTDEIAMDERSHALWGDDSRGTRLPCRLRQAALPGAGGWLLRMAHRRCPEGAEAAYRLCA
jgi:hypothetical protein